MMHDLPEHRKCLLRLIDLPDATSPLLKCSGLGAAGATWRPLTLSG